MAVTPFSKFEDVRQAVINILRGEQNNVGEFSMNTGTDTSTVVSHPNCAPGKSVQITPLNAAAAAAIPTTYIPRATIVKGSFTVQHAASGAVRSFMYEVTGGG